jgi:hypothetical protein
MRKETRLKNEEWSKAKMLQYLYLVATERNGNMPRPEKLDEVTSGDFCRVPLGGDYILWMFDTASDADAFRKHWAHILVEIVSYETD